MRGRVTTCPAIISSSLEASWPAGRRREHWTKRSQQKQRWLLWRCQTCRVCVYTIRSPGCVSTCVRGCAQVFFVHSLVFGSAAKQALSRRLCALSEAKEQTQHEQLILIIREWLTGRTSYPLLPGLDYTPSRLLTLPSSDSSVCHRNRWYRRPSSLKVFLLSIK